VTLIASVDCRECGARAGETHYASCDVHALYADSEYCGRCGHPRDWHRLDDALNISPTDPDAPFRCIGYDCEIGGPILACAAKCPDYVAG